MVNKNSKNTKLSLEEIVEAIKSFTGNDISRKGIKTVINAFGVMLLSQLKKGNEIQLKGLFTFSTRKSEAKEMKLSIGENKGQMIKVPAKIVPTCKFGSTIKAGLKSVKVK